MLSDGDFHKRDQYLSAIENMFYKGFGMKTKAEYELFMFHLLLEDLYEHYGFADDEHTSDYQLSILLGISQQKVRNLKVKERLVYGRKIDWKEELSKRLENARKDGDYIVIDIPEPNVHIEIQNFVQSHGGYIDVQLNSRLIRIKPEFLFMLAYELEPDENKKKTNKRIKKSLKEKEKGSDIRTGMDIAKEFGKTGLEVVSAIASTVEFFSPDNIVIHGLQSLLD